MLGGIRHADVCKCDANLFSWLVIRDPSQGGASGKQYQLKGLILAQNERWRRGLGMQVARQGFVSLLSELEERRKGE